MSLHKDCLTEEGRVAEQMEDLRKQLRDAETNYLAIIANMRVVSAPQVATGVCRKIDGCPKKLSQ